MLHSIREKSVQDAHERRQDGGHRIGFMSEPSFQAGASQAGASLAEAAVSLGTE
jgi:hypothetical protein